MQEFTTLKVWVCFQAFRDKRQGADESSDSESMYELECIEGYKKSRKKEQFYVKWRGYSSAENTWEPLKNLTGISAEEIEEARQKFGGKKVALKRVAKKGGKDAHSSDSNQRMGREAEAAGLSSRGGVEESTAA
ncbi:Heterochromatin protein, putative [Perkinsus marinus ATCC 50983]|uniref:Heterochromatin protein, putative n=1 Tax=Perkinsus marinus (strain ATCC 50983 / TXsc) TaxID=423536 RepID=C5K4V7_PERM5|nr:Heterochromatin protein, putative [Perkinsus marinus ATCC 50983]EER20379.1 Heterochromatin protein, putative [Perkinsus marinus ATCC 50983]|eukprot:XP_002788583.1 Heterochromatin protein, putative [Perkinsus marinus ATCC 50983]